jgi:hypothetical protein
MTNNFQVPMVAWYLDQPIQRVEDTPKNLKSGGAPNVIFQDASADHANLVPFQEPSAEQITTWEQGGAKYKVMSDPPVTLYLNCSPHGNK